MTAPRVLLSGVALAQPMGGVVRHNRELLPRIARLLEKRGGRLAIMEGTQPVPFDLPSSVERLRSDVPPGPALRRAAREGRALRRHLEAAAGRRAVPFELVHTGHLPVPRALPIPYSVTLHDLKSLTLRFEPAARRLFGRLVIGRAVARAAAVIVVSETLKRELLERFDVESGRIHVVPNAAAHLEPLPREPSASVGLLHVGHVERRKNLDLVVRALAADPQLGRLTLAGEPRGGEDERLKAIAAELGVEDRLRFAGLASDRALSLLYAAATCVVLPSLREGFGIPALEAQLAGAPLAVSRIPALLEVAGEGTPSFQPGDAAECAAAIRAAIETPQDALRAAAERAGRSTWDRSAELWVEALCAARGTASSGPSPASGPPRT